MRTTLPHRVWALVGLALTAAPAAAQPIPRPDHVVIAILENHSYSQIIGEPTAPYINGLLPQGASLLDSHGITHPSQPNYIALFSGSQQGVLDNNTPPGVPFSTPNLGAQMIAGGFSFTGYCEDLPSAGFTGDNANGASGYQRKHNPWVNWQQTGGGPPPPNQLAQSTNQPFAGVFPTDYATLPTLSFVVPNQINAMHDGTIAQGDTWLQNNLDGYVQWAKTHNSLFILTFDEDNTAPGNNNRIPTILVGQRVQQGVTSNQTLDHYGLLATLEDMYGLSRIGNAVGQTALNGIFTPVPEPGSLALLSAVGVAGVFSRRLWGKSGARPAGHSVE